MFSCTLGPNQDTLWTKITPARVFNWRQRSRLWRTGPAAESTNKLRVPESFARLSVPLCVFLPGKQEFHRVRTPRTFVTQRKCHAANSTECLCETPAGTRLAWCGLGGWSGSGLRGSGCVLPATVRSGSLELDVRGGRSRDGLQVQRYEAMAVSWC